MKYWVQYLTQSATDKTELIDACGDSAVFILDGRNSHETMRRDALRQAQRMQHWKQYAGFRLVSGPRLFEESRTSAVHKLTYPVITS